MNVFGMDELGTTVETVRYLLLRAITKPYSRKQMADIEDVLENALNVATDNQDIRTLQVVANMLLATKAWKRGKDLLAVRLLEDGW